MTMNRIPPTEKKSFTKILATWFPYGHKARQLVMDCLVGVRVQPTPSNPHKRHANPTIHVQVERAGSGAIVVGFDCPRGIPVQGVVEQIWDACPRLKNKPLWVFDGHTSKKLGNTDQLTSSCTITILLRTKLVNPKIQHVLDDHIDSVV